MKIVIISGSARKGNTLAAINAFIKGASEKNKIEIIEPDKLNIAPCKCYCRGLQLKNKKVGTIVVGGSPVDSIQYELIDKQFDCMAKYLSWDMLFNKSYYATARDELEKNKNSMNELEGIGKNL